MHGSGFLAAAFLLFCSLIRRGSGISLLLRLARLIALVRILYPVLELTLAENLLEIGEAILTYDGSAHVNTPIH